MTTITDFPAIRPSFLLDFANSGRVDPRVSCVRPSTATCYGCDGKLRTVAANVPRIDYDPATGKCLGLLVEEARTNLFTYSANVANAVWGKTNLTADGSKVLVGGADFYKVSEVVTAQPIGKNVRRMFPSAYPAGTALSIKWFFIEGTRRFCNVVILSAGATASIALDTKTGDFGIRQTGLPGWTWTVVKHLTGVIEVVAKNPSIHAEYPTGAYIDMRPTTVASLAEAGSIGDAYTGDTSQYVYVGPIQFELGASPTSYIPTDAAAVTRAAENIQLAELGSWYRRESGTWVADYVLAERTPSGTETIICASHKTENSRLQVRTGVVAARNAAGTQFETVIPATRVARIATTYGGGKSSTAKSGVLFPEVDYAAPVDAQRLHLGVIDTYWAGYWLNGYITRIAFIPAQLTRAQLQRVSAT